MNLHPEQQVETTVKADVHGELDELEKPVVIDMDETFVAAQIRYTENTLAGLLSSIQYHREAIRDLQLAVKGAERNKSFRLRKQRRA